MSSRRSEPNAHARRGAGDLGVEPEAIAETVRIPVTVLEDVRAHAGAEAPRECCGLLVGTPRAIERSVRARNLRASPTRYLIHPQDHFAALRAARDDGLAVVGAYHSHPASPPEPSETDLAEANYPEFLYVIVSLAEPTRGVVRAYRLGDGSFRAIAIEAADDRT